MLTYDLTNANEALYLYIYECIKKDIVKGVLAANEKMPSKRAFANHLGVSTITIENAYAQLVEEGYLYALPKKGYYVEDISQMKPESKEKPKSLHIHKRRKENQIQYDFSSNRTLHEDFPFSTWTKLMRQTLSLKERELMQVSPCEGVLELRQAIAEYLCSFRGMAVDPDQIIVGAGTEYLYSLLIKLLGQEKIYCIENPGYKKLGQIYESHKVKCLYVDMDQDGICIEKLKQKSVNVLHISPTHHFPTGITMPIQRRYEILQWAQQEENRYVIEDDYDSEFRIKGKPIAPLFSIDQNEKVIYMNTFSKSLASTIRISYMVLPRHLANRFFEELSFYSNTVSTFEQYTLASFIRMGYFEKHINSIRLRYKRKRSMVLEAVNECFSSKECHVLENDSGLHFLLDFHTSLTDQEIEEKLKKSGIRMEAITKYYMDDICRNEHLFILNYSSLPIDGLKENLGRIRGLIMDK